MSLLQIKGVYPTGLSYFRLNIKEYSTFPDEKEVLFMSVMLFKIIDISE